MQSQHVLLTTLTVAYLGACWRTHLALAIRTQPMSGMMTGSAYLFMRMKRTLDPNFSLV